MYDVSYIWCDARVICCVMFCYIIALRVLLGGLYVVLHVVCCAICGVYGCLYDTSCVVCCPYIVLRVASCMLRCVHHVVRVMLCVLCCMICDIYIYILCFLFGFARRVLCVSLCVPCVA